MNPVSDESRIPRIRHLRIVTHINLRTTLSVKRNPSSHQIQPASLSVATLTEQTKWNLNQNLAESESKGTSQLAFRAFPLQMTRRRVSSEETSILCCRVLWQNSNVILITSTIDNYWVISYDLVAINKCSSSVIRPFNWRTKTWVKDGAKHLPCQPSQHALRASLYILVL